MPSAPFDAVVIWYPSLCSRSCRFSRRHGSSSMRRIEGGSSIARLLPYKGPQRSLRSIDLLNEAGPLTVLHRDQRYAGLLLLSTRPFSYPPDLPKRLHRLLACFDENPQGYQRKELQGSPHCQPHALSAHIDALAMLWTPSGWPVRG